MKGPDAMDRMDADMMETEATTAAAAAAAPTQQVGQNDVGKDLLTVARNLIDQGKPSQALQAVIFIKDLFKFVFFFSIG